MPVPALTEHAIQAIAAHPLTGNVRELENLLHRAVALSEGDELHVDGVAPPAGGFPTAAGSASPAPAQAPDAAAFTPIAVPDTLQAEDASSPRPALGGAPGSPMPGASTPLPSDLQAWLDQQERDILVRALREAGFNRTATAARLGISLRQIRYRIARLNIAVPNDQDAHDDIG